MFRYYLGTHIFPDVLFNDIAGPDGNPLLLSLKLSVDVLVSNREMMSRLPIKFKRKFSFFFIFFLNFGILWPFLG